MEFGITNGKTVNKYVITNGVITADILSFGATIQSLKVPDKKGNLVDVVLGYNTLDEYVKDDGYLGAVVGRVCNSIANGRFCIDGKQYEISKNHNRHSHHGGFEGFNKKIWDLVEYKSDSVTLKYFSRDGEEGYPGNLTVNVTYAITKRNGLKIEYLAVTDKDTIVNLTNHTYYNLNGENDATLSDQELYINADMITPVDENLITYNEYMDVTGTPYDFRECKLIEKDIDSKNSQIVNGGGYDINYVLCGDGFRKVVYAKSNRTGIEIDVYTDRHGMQFYTTNSLSERQGKNAIYKRRSAFCLEFQHFPNAINCGRYCSPLLKKGDEYSAKTEIVFK